MQFGPMRDIDISFRPEHRAQFEELYKTLGPNAKPEKVNAASKQFGEFSRLFIRYHRERKLEELSPLFDKIYESIGPQALSPAIKRATQKLTKDQKQLYQHYHNLKKLNFWRELAERKEKKIAKLRSKQSSHLHIQIPQPAAASSAATAHSPSITPESPIDPLMQADLKQIVEKIILESLAWMYPQHHGKFHEYYLMQRDDNEAFMMLMCDPSFAEIGLLFDDYSTERDKMNGYLLKDVFQEQYSDAQTKMWVNPLAAKLTRSVSLEQMSPTRASTSEQDLSAVVTTKPPQRRNSFHHDHAPGKLQAGKKHVSMGDLTGLSPVDDREDMSIQEGVAQLNALMATTTMTTDDAVAEKPLLDQSKGVFGMLPRSRHTRKSPLYRSKSMTDIHDPDLEHPEPVKVDDEKSTRKSFWRRVFGI